MTRRLPLRLPRLPVIGEPIAGLLRLPLVRGLEQLFAPQPIVRTPGDDGLFGPRSTVWQVHRDVSVFVGAIRALVVQALHPEVVAGVVDHSAFRDQPLRRLQNTSAWVTRVIYASTDEALATIHALSAVHAPVSGRSHRGRRYHASDPPLLSWVHNALVDSFLAAHRAYGPGLDDAEADRYVVEMTRLGALLGCDALPDRAETLRAWLCDHPDVQASPGLDESLGFLANPPLPWAYRLPYFALFQGALATIPAPFATLTPAALPGATLGAEAVLLAFRSVLPDTPRAAA